MILRAMVQPVDSLIYLFESNRQNNLYNIGHNGQVCYLRAVLNDAFDIELRRIQILDSERYDWTYIYPEETDRPFWLEVVPIASEAFTWDEGTDFSVIVPPGLNRDMLPQMISLVNYYKLAGKRYAIIFE